MAAGAAVDGARGGLGGGARLHRDADDEGGCPARHAGGGARQDARPRAAQGKGETGARAQRPHVAANLP
eukprot:4172097-Prymnesium_polylepis.2